MHSHIKVLNVCYYVPDWFQRAVLAQLQRRLRLQQLSQQNTTVGRCVEIYYGALFASLVALLDKGSSFSRGRQTDSETEEALVYLHKLCIHCLISQTMESADWWLLKVKQQVQLATGWTSFVSNLGHKKLHLVWTPQVQSRHQNGEELWWSWTWSLVPRRVLFTNLRVVWNHRGQWAAVVRDKCFYCQKYYDCQMKSEENKTNGKKD